MPVLVVILIVLAALAALLFLFYLLQSPAQKRFLKAMLKQGKHLLARYTV